MATTLLLRMPPPASDETEWLVVDEGGMRSGPRQRGPLSLAAAVAQSHRVVALVPATDVMLVEPELPPGSGAKLARAVPFALEELLLSVSNALSQPRSPLAKSADELT